MWRRRTLDRRLYETLRHVADFYDRNKVGDAGPLGFRRSSDLKTLLRCADRLLDNGVLLPGQTRFLDLGCADGRVNVFFSYLVRVSVGIELDAWTLGEYGALRSDLDERLRAGGYPLPPENIHLFSGDSMEDGTHRRVLEKTGTDFEEFDLFYTYLVMHEEFARLIARRAKPGAVFMVYGLERILPVYEALRLMKPLSPLEGILALYRKS